MMAARTGNFREIYLELSKRWGADRKPVKEDVNSQFYPPFVT